MALAVGYCVLSKHGVSLLMTGDQVSAFSLYSIHNFNWHVLHICYGETESILSGFGVELRIYEGFCKHFVQLDFVFGDTEDPLLGRCRHIRSEDVDPAHTLLLL